MRLGLIGTGKQGQRYLLEKNGGRHIVRSGSRDLDDWEGLGGVIIATHPAGHRTLAMYCIQKRLPFLIEKPLALTLEDCMAIIDASQHAGVPMHVAHLDTWAWDWCAPVFDPDSYAVITYSSYRADVLPWLDWAPHALALLDRVAACKRANVIMGAGESDSLTVRSGLGGGVYYQRKPQDPTRATPMWLAVRDIKKNGDWDSYRRIYRALFSEE